MEWKILSRPLELHKTHQENIKAEKMNRSLEVFYEASQVLSEHFYSLNVEIHVSEFTQDFEWYMQVKIKSRDERKG